MFLHVELKVITQCFKCSVSYKLHLLYPQDGMVHSCDLLFPKYFLFGKKEITVFKPD